MEIIAFSLRLYKITEEVIHGSPLVADTNHFVLSASWEASTGPLICGRLWLLRPSCYFIQPLVVTSAFQVTENSVIKFHIYFVVLEVSLSL